MVPKRSPREVGNRRTWEHQGMALGLWYSKSVVLIAGSKEVDADPKDAKLYGTGFIVMIPSADPEIGFSYLVTAAHVVRLLTPLSSS